MRRRSFKGLFAVVIIVILSLALASCGGNSGGSNVSTSNSVLPLTDPNYSSDESSESTEPDPALQPRPGMPDYVGKYGLFKMVTADQTLDKDDLEILYKDSGGVAKNFVDIIDLENLHLALSGNANTVSYTKTDDTFLIKDSIGNSLELVLNGDELSLEFSDKLLGAQGEGYTVYFKKLATES